MEYRTLRANVWGYRSLRNEQHTKTDTVYILCGLGRKFPSLTTHHNLLHSVWFAQIQTALMNQLYQWVMHVVWMMFLMFWSDNEIRGWNSVHVSLHSGQRSQKCSGCPISLIQFATCILWYPTENFKTYKRGKKLAHTCPTSFVN